ncbi:hypothetical protein DIPPA_07575 [Diplonema papillatum]|nr:hypothetical protein DIPPA_07575 [Diplonema papillatum]
MPSASRVRAAYRPKQFWSEESLPGTPPPSRVISVKEHVSSPEVLVERDAPVAAEQFWQVNEQTLRSLGLRDPSQVACTVEKDSQGARVTFALPICPIHTNTRHQLATSFKRAHYKHRKVLVIIVSSAEQPQAADRLKMLANIGIANVNVVYQQKGRLAEEEAPPRTPDQHQQHQQQQQQHHHGRAEHDGLLDLLSPLLADALRSLMRAAGLQSGMQTGQGLGLGRVSGGFSRNGA